MVLTSLGNGIHFLLCHDPYCGFLFWESEDGDGHGYH